MIPLLQIVQEGFMTEDRLRQYGTDPEGVKSELDLLHGFDLNAHVAKSSGYQRKRMPQIDEKDMEYVLKHFKNNKNYKIRKLTMTAAALKPSQGEFDSAKINEMVTSGKDFSKKSFLCSNDWRIVDGHHRHIACLIKNSSTPITVYKTNLPIERLLKVLNHLKVTYKEGFASKDQDGLNKSEVDRP